VLEESVAQVCCSFTRLCKNTHDIKNTPEGVVRMCFTGLLFSLPGSARNTNGIKNTPEGVVRMCCTGLLFLYQAVQGTKTALKTHQRV
jgi:hypothetical protein